MPRIPNEEIDRIKRDTDLIALIQSRGLKLEKQGANWIGFCPFHKDTKTPNLIVTPSKGLFRCMASCCGRAGNAIQFVEWHDGVSFRHAFELLSNGGSAAFEASTPAKRTLKTKLKNPITNLEDEQQILQQVVNYYHSRFDKTCLSYLQGRGIGSEKMLKTFKLGFSDRSLGLRIPHGRTVEGESIRKKLVSIGVYRDTGREHLNGCLTVPIKDLQGEITQIYGRRLDPKAKKHLRHLYLAKPLAGIFNPTSFANNNREIILTESILDALTFWHHGMENVTCTFGTENFTEELFTTLKDRKIESVRLAFDADEAGDKATTKISHKLQSIGIECHQIKFPWGLDANQYTKDQGGASLKKAVRDAVWLGSGKACAPVQLPAGAPLSNDKIAASLAAEVATPSSAKVAKEKKNIPVSSLQKQGEHYTLALDERSYRVGGLHKNNSLEVLRITLRLTTDSLMHVDSLDLYRDGERRKFIDRASEETLIDKTLLKRDLGKLLLALEQTQEERLNGEEQTDEAHTLTPEETQAALDFLKSPNLLEKITQSYEQAGIVGEKTNILAAYLACVSRKLNKPLAIIIQSTSAAGKSTLMEAVLSFFPKDELVKYSAMTGQSLYYLGETNLKHKILAIVEEEGAEKASYALKLLQSEGELTIASTGKDPHSGRMETQEYHVEGPVAIIFTTTSIDIDEELMNRCLVLTVDESKAQTEKIHQLQRLARTPEGILASEQRKQITTLMQNAQRLIQPMKIANPYAQYLTFTSGRTRTRRDHEKYLTLIDTIALLHQHQRQAITHKIGTGPNAREIQMLPVTLADIEAANRLAPEVLGRSLDELPPQTRRLLEHIQQLVQSKLKEGPEGEETTSFFSRKELRELSGWSQTQIRRHLDTLIDLEYIRQLGGKNGVRMQYKLLADITETKGYSIGLIDVKTLKKKQK